MHNSTIVNEDDDMERSSRSVRPSAGGLQRLIAAVAVAMVAATGLAACTTDEPAAGPAILRIGVAADLTGLNPATGRHDRPIRPLAYEWLIQLNSEGEFVPGLATEWSYFDDNRGFEMKLRPDTVFSDGTPVDAAAVKAWIEYFVEAKGPVATRLSIASVETVGDDIVRIHLAKPDPTVEVIFAINNWGAVASPAALEDPTVLDTATYGAGPYTLDPDRTVTGDTYTYVPNEYYYDPSKVVWDEVVVKVITNPTSMLQAVQAGQIDVAIGDPSTADAASGAGIDVVSAPAVVESYIIADLKGDLFAPTGDVRVRQAMNYAIDREAIAAAIGGNYGTPTSMISVTDGQVPDYVDYYVYDPDRARELLADAGYADGFTLTVVETPDKSDLTQAVASNLAEVGIKLEVTTAATGSDFLREIGAHTAALVSLELPTEAPAWYFYTASMMPGSFFNYTAWDIPDLTKLAVDGSTSPDGDWIGFTKLATEEAVYLPIFKSDTIYYVSDEVDGVVVSEASGGYPLVSEWSPAR